MQNLAKQEPQFSLTHQGNPSTWFSFFVSAKKDLQDQMPKAKSLIKEKGLLWVTFPKGKTEINRDSIREYAFSLRLQAVSLMAIDNTWSALRLKVV